MLNKYSVCEAFEIAKEDVRRTVNVTEASKYKLKISEVYKKGRKTPCKHKCFPILNFKKGGGFVKFDQEPMFNCIPSKIECFEGRTQEMYDVIFLLNQWRLVNILGYPGIGKTSFARNICNYINDRK